MKDYPDLRETVRKDILKKLFAKEEISLKEPLKNPASSMDQPKIQGIESITNPASNIIPRTDKFRESVTYDAHYGYGKSFGDLPNPKIFSANNPTDATNYKASHDEKYSIREHQLMDASMLRNGGDADRSRLDKMTSTQMYYDGLMENRSGYYPLKKSQYEVKAPPLFTSCATSPMRETGSTKITPNDIVDPSYYPNTAADIISHRSWAHTHPPVAAGTMLTTTATSALGKTDLYPMNPKQSETIGTFDAMSIRRSSYPIDLTCNASESSEISQRTVASRKSSHDLKKLEKSKCRLHQDVKEIIESVDTMIEHKSQGDSKDTVTLQGHDTWPNRQYGIPVHPSHNSEIHKMPILSDIARADYTGPNHISNDVLTITVNDVVNTKIINPLIAKLQQKFVNKLRDDISLMEDLESIPRKVDEVYKATLLKPKE
ncbi:uncharacterized protein LOC142230361 [Haematobia irritans]|uniref:uncharacterized protein LOC142230361 n=1 Tax=Haematobia irritans TaxID=7368 RepID=UPI003F4FB203